MALVGDIRETLGNILALLEDDDAQEEEDA